MLRRSAFLLHIKRRRYGKILPGCSLYPDELDVVHQKYVRLTIFLSKLGGCFIHDGLDDLVRKILAFDIDHVAAFVDLFDLVADRIEQVGFSQSGVAV